MVSPEGKFLDIDIVSQNRLNEKTTLKLHKTAYPALEIPLGVYLIIFKNQGATKTYQTPFIDRIEIGPLEKKIRFDNWLELGTDGPTIFFCIFEFPVSQNVRNMFSEKKSRFYDKFIILIVQNELLYTLRAIKKATHKIW